VGVEIFVKKLNTANYNEIWGTICCELILLGIFRNGFQTCHCLLYSINSLKKKKIMYLQLTYYSELIINIICILSQKLNKCSLHKSNLNNLGRWKKNHPLHCMRVSYYKYNNIPRYRFCALDPTFYNEGKMYLLCINNFSVCIYFKTHTNY